MKNSKAVGQSDLVSEMVKTKGEGGIEITREVVNWIILGIIPPAEKEFRKGNSLSRGKSRGNKSADQIPKQTWWDTTGGHWLDKVWFDTKAWRYKHHIYLESVEIFSQKEPGEIFSQKKELLFSIWKFERNLWLTA